jgi:penicillin-binding protein 2
LPSGHGTISLQEALTQSCDTCFYQVAQHLDGIDQNILPQFARAFGFGSPTGIDYVSEAPGLVGDNAWKEKVYHDAWRAGDTVNLSIGQGFFLATPLQTAAMLAAVADGGTRHVPQLILSVAGEPSATPAPKVAGHLPVTAAQLQAIVRGMVGVTTESTGTATFKFLNFPWVVAGKTGTAQNPGVQPHAWFGAFAPADHPRIALAVVVENGGEGSYVAAPVARTILQTFLSEPVASTVTGPQALPVPSH